MTQAMTVMQQISTLCECTCSSDHVVVVLVPGIQDERSNHSKPLLFLALVLLFKKYSQSVLQIGEYRIEITLTSFLHYFLHRIIY